MPLDGADINLPLCIYTKPLVLLAGMPFLRMLALHPVGDLPGLDWWAQSDTTYINICQRYMTEWAELSLSWRCVVLSLG